MSGTTGGKVEIEAKKVEAYEAKGGMRQSQNATGAVRQMHMTIMQTANTQSIETRSSDSIVLFQREAGSRSSKFLQTFSLLIHKR